MRTTGKWPAPDAKAPRKRTPPRDAGTDHQTDAVRCQAQKMEALGRLTSGVAPDFNNMLTVISGYSQLLLTRMGLDHELRQELLQIQQASERAAACTRQLLCFSTRQTCPSEEIDLNEVVAEHARMLRPLMGDDIELDTVLADGLPTLKASPGQLLQILLILAANAHDAMPGGGHLTLATGLGPCACGAQTAGSRTDETPLPLGAAGDRAEASSALPAVSAPRTGATAEVMLRVTDSGCGMDEPVMARLVRPSYPLHASGQGTGVGLTMVAEIVKEMNGRIEVESQPGQGGSISLYFPATEKSPPATAEPQGGPAPLRGNETILVVEDADYVRALMERVLTMHGYTVLTASDGHQAQELAKNCGRKIDLLITDVVMPQMSGRQVAECLARLNQGLRVLYVSGYTASVLERPAHEGTGEANGEGESDFFLQKPFTPDLLLRKVREVLGSS